ncbi:hypothetical protein C4561_01560 [candidate division WWE3 bacterium]|uniref:Phage virion morphogenesis protein n=1 Tax=candidate division WWE3 bacterium TaxID=2053526 RepID=A0A3A4ZM41_UNCKA|nr:MAG: hypothetical protein C4561_01560 [candidate division WWE3 bacterium]
MKIDDKEVIKLMKDLRAKTKTLKPFFVHSAIPVIQRSTMMNFRAGGRPQRWEALSSLTLMNRGNRVAKHALGQNILIDSGRLQKSIGTVRNITDFSLEYGTNLIYAAVHQFGAVIRPVRAKALTIPLPNARPGSSARDYSNTFVAKGVIFQKTAKGEAIPLFKLLLSVRIPSRPFMVWLDEDIYTLQRNLLMFITESDKYSALNKG